MFQTEWRELISSTLVYYIKNTPLVKSQCTTNIRVSVKEEKELKLKFSKIRLWSPNCHITKLYFDKNLEITVV